MGRARRPLTHQLRCRRSGAGKMLKGMFKRSQKARAGGESPSEACTASEGCVGDEGLGDDTALHPSPRNPKPSSGPTGSWPV